MRFLISGWGFTTRLKRSKQAFFCSNSIPNGRNVGFRNYGFRGFIIFFILIFCPMVALLPQFLGEQKNLSEQQTERSVSACRGNIVLKV